MEIPDGGEDGAQEHEEARGLTVAEINALGTPEAPGADHEEGAQEDVGDPDDAAPPGGDGIAQAQVDDGGQASGAAGDGHADEILAAGASGILGLRIELNVEARQAAGSGGEKGKGDDGAELNQLVAQVGIERERQAEESPEPGENAGSDAEGDHVGQRIELLAEVAGGVGEARDGSVHAVKENRKADGEGRMIEVDGRGAQRIDARDGSKAPARGPRRAPPAEIA